MDANYHTNRILASRSNNRYFAGSSSRQYGSGIGSAIRVGLKSFVIPLAKRYGITLAKNFLSSAAQEVLELLDGGTKPKTALKKVVKNTIRKQVGGGRRKRRKTKATRTRKRKTTTRRRRRKSSAKKSRRRKSKPKKTTSTKKQKKQSSSSFERKRVLPRSRQDFFTSIVDRASSRT